MKEDGIQATITWQLPWSSSATSNPNPNPNPTSVSEVKQNSTISKTESVRIEE